NFSLGLNRDALKKLLSFATPLIVSAVAALIISRIDRFILAYYLPLAAITFYSLPYTLSEKLSIAVANVTSVVFPFASELHARDDFDKVRELYLRSTKTLTLMTLPITVILVTIPGPILKYWLGTEYAIQGSTCLALVALAGFLNAVGAVPTVTSLGIGRPWMPSFFAVTTSALALTLNFLLIPHFGITGAALAF